MLSPAEQATVAMAQPIGSAISRPSLTSSRATTWPVTAIQRLITKVREHGFRFFTTQILYEGEWMSCLLLDLVRRMGLEHLV